MESKYMTLREELIELGYTQTLKPDCVPLVERLLSDLKTTTESLQKYMNIAQQAIEERDNLQLGAEPYKCDNAKLIRECNELHLAFIQFKEQHEKVQRELKTKVVSLQNQLEVCDLERRDYQRQTRDLEVQLSKIEKKATKTTSRSQPSVSKVDGTRKSFQLDTAMASADQKIASLNKELKKLKQEQLVLVENNDLLKTQLQNRDVEITRLKTLLEGGRPLEAVNKECCFKNIDNKIGALRQEINALKREKNTLHNQLKDALAKQHEAMRRALHLADRNKVLEKEMKDIDQMALAVEAECNSTVRSNAEKVTRLQDRMNESVIMIQKLERENSKLKQDKQELSADLDAVKLEKKHLQSLVDKEIEDKKRLTDRINSFTIIEKDLNLEIDRLVKLSGEQKRKIAELECQITDEKVKASSIEPPKQQPTFQREYLRIGTAEMPDSTAKKTTVSDKASKGKAAPKKGKSVVKKRFTTAKGTTDGIKLPAMLMGYESQIGRCCCEAEGCVKHLKELLDKEVEYRQTQAMQQVESLKQEKEYYMKEYHRICDQMRNVPTHDKPSELQAQYQQLLKEVDEKNKTITDLQNKVHNLSQEKRALGAKLEAMKAQSDAEADAVCKKMACRRQRRELEIIRNEFKQLERDNESLKSKMQSLNESKVFDQDKMKKAFQEMEEHIKKLENERRDMVVSQTTSRSNQAQLEEDNNKLKEQLKTIQAELNSQKANYNQLKVLQEQADKALSDAQNKVRKLEAELAEAQSKVGSTHRESESRVKEIGKLQGDIQYMKSQLSKIDKEKDNLVNVVDEKTEKIAKLEDELKEKKGVVSGLEMELKELKRKLGDCSDESSSQKQSLRAVKQELATLQKEYDTEKKLKECALQENKRLQSEKASLVNDCQDARKQLDIMQRQVEDLKRQLQHYVAEVKRTEDLISQKELERTEILDQFKCLSEEANILETNNHTLENEASQSRVQLSVALDHASDLERKLENQESVVRCYEKQITELTTQVASLEIQLKQCNNQYDRLTTELQQTKDLCVKLDRERDSLKRELREGEDQRGDVERNIDFHVRQNEELKKTLDKERNNADGVEKLLKDARQDLIEQRLLNQDLHSEMTKLKAKIDELQERLMLAKFAKEQEARTVCVPRKSLYKLSNKNDRFGTDATRTANTRRISVLDKNRDLPSSSHSSYYEYECKRSNCSVHKNRNREQIAKRVEERGSTKKIYPILKHTSLKADTHRKPICFCSCPQCHLKYESNKDGARSSGETDADRKGLSLLKYSRPQTRCSDTSLQKRKKQMKSLSSSSPDEIVSVSSRTSLKKENVSNGSFKNKLKVEVPGMECCISSNNVIK